ncbi:MAG: hypothetical protein WC735_04985 [Candidatus Paceibacterota bacterium]|jgi:hypothetical protein
MTQTIAQMIEQTQEGQKELMRTYPNVEKLPMVETREVLKLAIRLDERLKTSNMREDYE